MCILDILRLHISHNYKNNKRKRSKAKSECTDMSMINWSRKKALTKDERSKKLLLQISDFDDDYLPSLSDSICCSEYIINGGYCSKQHLYKEDDEDKKPEWLKQWTISKGWMHDRSHMLSLGVGSLDSSNIILDQTPRELDTASKTEDSSSNENDLISIIELESTTSKKDNNTYNTDKSGSCTKNDIDFDKIEIDKTDIYSQLNINYRRTFPVVHTDDKHFDTLKKYFTPNENEIQYTRIIFPSRQKLFKKSNQLKKFGKYKTFDDLTSIQNEEEQKQSRKRNPKGFSLANFRSNIQQDTIYECSEDSFSLYNNPIYEPIHTDNIELLEGERDISTYQSFNNDTNCQYQRYLNNDLNTNKLLPKDTKKSGSFKSKLSTEKYIIRHIRIRIMMTLRLRKFQRIYRKRIRSEKKVMCSNAGKKRNNFIKVCSESADVNLMRHDILKVHEEQRKIGNGETSLKIQNLRYGRLNVLRWLLWESQTQTQSQTASIGEMPALERDRSTSSALALHYAAARGCLDCVRLLVDSSTDLSANTQMDNDVTPVYLAAQEGHLEVLKFLVLEAGGSLYVRAKDGMAPLHAASQMGCLNCVKWMIQEQGVDPNLRDGDGATPLHFAASRGHLETVRWLLRHGARLSLDKYGKSPINDAAENQQVECLNVLVQHGTTPDYNDSDRSTKNTCSCQRKPDAQNRNHSSDCNSCVKNSTEPFYLHPPTINSTRTNTLEAPHAPQDGLYINPMNNHRHSTSSSSGSCSGDSMNGESFYLHNPQEVIYNRVKDLFESSTMNRHQPMSALTVKVEVHSSSSGAGSDENLSSSDLSERSGDHDHDYEDIYMARDESKNKDRTSGIRSRSRDSGSHSRSGSASSSNSGCNVVVTKVPKDGKNKESKNEIRKTNEFLPKPQKYEKPAKKEDKNSQESGLSSSPSDMYSEEENEKVKLAARHSLQPKSNNNNRLVKRVVSVPGDICPPPPPPPPPGDTKGDDKNDNKTEYDVEIITERTVRPSDVLKGMHRSISTISAAKRLNSSCSDLTIISLNTETDEEKHGPNLVNKQRVLPFIPPSFPGSTDSNNLIKPSEYLRSISDKRSSVSSVKSSDYEETIIVTEEKKDEVIIKPFNGPPPPPLPPASDAFPAIKPKDNDTDANKKQTQPLSAISIHDLNSVQLRRTDKMLASKTFSAPTRSMSLQCLQSESYIAQKTDLIAELKMSKDITGIKKMKVERNKVQEKQEKEMFTEISKQFTATNFVEKIPDKDNTGNIIPAWKRQMLAKKAAERARKELEEQLQKEAEEKRLQAIPQWKRQLLAKKEETENKIKNTIYTPKVVDDVRTVKHDLEECWRQHSPTSEEKDNKENKPEIVIDPPKEDNPKSEEDTNIIPWRAQLRKTNSKLNLLD